MHWYKSLKFIETKIIFFKKNTYINPLASPSVGDPTLKYGDVNTVTTSPCEVKGLIS